MDGLIYWLECNSSDSEERRTIINFLTENENVRKYKGENYHVEMSIERYKLISKIYPKVEKEETTE